MIEMVSDAGESGSETTFVVKLELMWHAGDIQRHITQCWYTTGEETGTLTGHFLQLAITRDAETVDNKSTLYTLERNRLYIAEEYVACLES